MNIFYTQGLRLTHKIFEQARFPNPSFALQDDRLMQRAACQFLQGIGDHGFFFLAADQFRRWADDAFLHLKRMKYCHRTQRDPLPAEVEAIRTQ